MTRMDNVLIYLPFLVYCFFISKNKPKRLKTILIGFAGIMPFILWEIFSVWYYGFPFPNTAYNKLSTGIALGRYLLKGIEYIVASFAMDPMVIIIPAIYIFTGLLLSRDIRHKLLSFGILLYILYVVRIGGDFMSGRHFTVIYILSASGIILCLHDLQLNWNKRLAYLSIICIMYASTLGDLLGGYTRGGLIKLIRAGGDERYIYFRQTSLLINTARTLSGRELIVNDKWDSQEIKDVRNNNYHGAILSFGGGIIVYANSDLYLLDAYGIGDPLLSRLPTEKVQDNNFLIAHVKREIPEGYAESVRDNNNQITNPSLHKYYDVIRLITRGELFDPERIRAIIDMNLGRYDYLIDEYIATTFEKL